MDEMKGSTIFVVANIKYECIQMANATYLWEIWAKATKKVNQLSGYIIDEMFILKCCESCFFQHTTSNTDGKQQFWKVQDKLKTARLRICIRAHAGLYLLRDLWNACAISTSIILIFNIEMHTFLIKIVDQSYIVTVPWSFKNCIIYL